MNEFKYDTKVVVNDLIKFFETIGYTWDGSFFYNGGYNNDGKELWYIKTLDKNQILDTNYAKLELNIPLITKEGNKVIKRLSFNLFNFALYGSRVKRNNDDYLTGEDYNDKWINYLLLNKKGYNLDLINAYLRRIDYIKNKKDTDQKELEDCISKYNELKNKIKAH